MRSVFQLREGESLRPLRFKTVWRCAPMGEQHKKTATQGVQRRDLNAAERVSLALKLRAARMTYDQIAAQCGYENRGTAWRAVQRELQRNISTNVEEMRREEL